ncbi:MAG: M24 family metallopeptidase [Bacteroidales bacterium]|nr:M24 family metallopeptidase [Bacteroidales bacterium]MBR2298908.1 M24 family metallopeptidase [Bacteroidales bacterium]
MDRRGAIISLRTLMERKGISAMIIPSNDPHFGEYIPDHYKCREWLSCFTGSAGTLVVTGQSAALWTDSRYFVQADKELAGTGILLMKLKIAGTPSIPEWIKSELPEGGTVAIDEDLFTYSEYKGYLSALDPLKVEMISDPFDEIWEGRPSLEFHSVECMPESVSGESVISKRERLCAALGVGTPFAYVVTALDEIAWLCNIRGCDVEYNPLVIAYAIVTTDKITLFGCVNMFPEQVKSYLRSQNVEIVGYSSLTDALKGLGDDVVKIFSSDQATAKNYMAAGPNILPDPTTGGTLNLMKAKKNSVELDGFRRACAEDAKAWKKLLEYLRVNIVEKDPQEYILNPLTEYDIAEKLIEFRSESEDYRGESFEPIVAYAANGALPHYTATKESYSVIRQKGFLLIDSGAQYTYGTTDTTRTIPMGPLTQEEMEDYTAVLKGMTDLSMARFPQGTRGAQLDILARGPLFSRGKKYLHGTGHGIGHYLCVHEGPQSIRMEENPVHLYPGMVLSNEPAVYVEGSHGIRIENTIVVSPWKVGDDGEYYEFETITQIPISTDPVVWSRLSEEEKQWLYSHGFIDQPPM